MRLTVDYAVLIRAVKALSTFASRDNLGLRLEAGEKLTLICQSEASGVSVVVPGCEVHRTGSATVPLETFVAVVTNCWHGENLHLTANDNGLSIVAWDDFDLRQHIGAATQFTPFSGAPHSALTITVPSSDWLNLVNRVAFATARKPYVHTDGKSYSLNGVFLEVLSRSIRLTATDSEQLVTYSMDTKSNKRQHECVLPAWLLRKWCRSFTSDAIKLTLWKGYAQLESGLLKVWTKCLEETYPRLMIDLLGQPRSNAVTLPVQRLVDRLRSVMAVAGTQEAIVTLTVDAGAIRLTANGDGQSTAEWPVNYAGAPMRFDVSGRKLLAYLSTLPEECDVIVDTADDGEPIRCREAGAKYGGYLLSQANH